MRRRRALVPALALGLLVPASPAAARGVLVVGDSLAVGTAPYLKHDLAGTPIRFDVKVGRPSPEGVALVRRELRPDDAVVVFDLGTNDAPSVPAALTHDLEEARAITGERCLVVATVNRPPVGRITTAGLNAALRGFAAKEDNVLLVPWHDEAQTPGVLGPDRTHATGAGYAARGRVFAQAISACVGATSSLDLGAPAVSSTLPTGKSKTIAPATTPRPTRPAHAAKPAGPSPVDRARLYGTMAALVGRLVDVVSGNLEA